MERQVVLGCQSAAGYAEVSGTCLLVVQGAFQMITSAVHMASLTNDFFQENSFSLLGHFFFSIENIWERMARET